MSATLMGVVTAIYVGVAASELSNGHYGMVVVFVGYAIANLGFIWAML